jgi:hypothetical protein
MFYRDALLRCCQLEEDIASLYAALAESKAADADSAQAWSQAARNERENARILRAAAELSIALDEDGPFLVQIRLQLAACRKLVERVRASVAGVEDAGVAGALVQTLDSVPREEVRAALLEVAEGELRRLLRQIESQSKTLRRSRAARSRSPVRPRGIPTRSPATLGR